jgi:ribosome-associated protein
MTNLQATDSIKLRDIVTGGLLDGKAQDLKVFDVKDLTTIADYMVIATGSSTRQVKALSRRVSVGIKNAGYSILGIEGEIGCEWVLVDAGDVLVHIMHPDTRDFYQLERLWEGYAHSKDDVGIS